jgi:putative nucleotidyltransferase with HDIG domain
MLAGLIHDIGKYYIYMRADQHPELFSDEEALMQIISEWHADIGAAILDAWGFSQEYIDVALEHNNHGREHNGEGDIIDVVILANLHANVGKPHAPKEWGWIPALEKLNLTPEKSIQLLRESRDEIKSIIVSLQ